MELVLLTALGVGGATVFGSVLGFLFKKISHRFSDIVLSFAAGVMLCAAVTGLILPSLEYKSAAPLLICIIGVFCGAVCLSLIDKLIPHLHRLSGTDQEAHPQMSAKRSKVLLFVMAIAIHNLPEGIAAGVGFGSGDNAQALTIAAGIALQNIPEGMVIIAPMLASGISPKRTFLSPWAQDLWKWSAPCLATPLSPSPLRFCPLPWHSQAALCSTSSVMK